MSTLRDFPMRAGQIGFVLAREALARKPGIYYPYGLPVRADGRADIARRYRLARGLRQQGPMVALVTHHLAPDTDVIELGAGIGVLSASIRAQIGAHASHLVVEPDPEIAPLALENAHGAMPERTALVQAALHYSGDARVRFVCADGPTPGHVATGEEAGIVIPTTTLADLAGKLSDRFAIICDIEGAEQAMIEAERDGPALARCDLLLMATHPDRYADGAAMVASMRAHLAEIGLMQVAQTGNAIAYARDPAS